MRLKAPFSLARGVLGRVGLEPGRSIANAQAAATQGPTPRELHDLAEHICRQTKNPNGVRPADLVRRRYPNRAALD